MGCKIFLALTYYSQSLAVIPSKFQIQAFWRPQVDDKKSDSNWKNSGIKIKNDIKKMFLTFLVLLFLILIFELFQLLSEFFK